MVNNLTEPVFHLKLLMKLQQKLKMTSYLKNRKKAVKFFCIKIEIIVLHR